MKVTNHEKSEYLTQGLRSSLHKNYTLRNQFIIENSVLLIIWILKVKYVAYIWDKMTNKTFNGHVKLGEGHMRFV